MVEACLRQIDFLDEEVATVDKALAELVLASPEARRLMTLPGVSFVTAAALMGAIGDIARFPTARHLVSYLGLDPRVRQSGSEPAHHGRISKQGPWRGPTPARRGSLACCAHLRRSARLPRAGVEQAGSKRRGRCRRSQARRHRFAHAHRRRGLRLRTSLARTREALSGGAAPRRRASPGKRNPRSASSRAWTSIGSRKSLRRRPRSRTAALSRTGSRR